MKLLLLFKGKKTQKNQPRRRSAALDQEGRGAAAFRRSSTLTGSLSDDVKAGAEDHGQLQTVRLEAQSKRRQRRRAARRLLVLGSFLFILWALWANRIGGYDISFAGNIVRRPDAKIYVDSARKFSGNNLRNQFIFSLQKEQLAAYMMGHHPEIQTVSFKQGLFDRTPHLEVSLRKPVLIWQTSRNNQAFYVDTAGTPFLFNGYNNEAQLVRVNDESGVPAELGGAVASSRQIKFLGQLVGQVNQLSAGKLKVAKITFPPSSTKEINVNLDGRKYFIKVYLDRTPQAQAEQIAKSVSHLEQKGITPSDYLDVRIAERVFYK